MSEVTQILKAFEEGDLHAASQLLPLVYDELRKLAAAKLAQEKAGQTLQATALVHEAYVRLVGADADKRWDGRGHFFVAAAEAMRRILVENARRKRSLKHGGDHPRVEFEEQDLAVRERPEELLALDEALTELACEDPPAAEVVKLHIFAGLTMDESAMALGISRATAYRHWTYAKAWLRTTLRSRTGEPPG